MHHKYLVLPVKKWLKSVHIYGGYRKIKTGTVFWNTRYVWFMLNASRLRLWYDV